MKIILLLFLFFANPARAWSDWSDSDRALFISSSVAMTADWATTRYAARNDWPDGLYETNPILGKYPHQDQVDLYFVTMLISNYFIADYFKGNNRTFYLAIRTVTHGAAAQNNVSLGMRLQF
jgi:hypothetical protein